MPASAPHISLARFAAGRGGSSLGLVVCAAVLVFVALVAVLWLGGRGNASSAANQETRLLVMAAAGLREPMEEIAAQYYRQHGVRIEIQYGGSNSLLNQLQVDRISAADLFLAADESYARLAVESGLAQETLAIATQRPVVIVRKDSGLTIDAFADLLVEGLRLSMGDPEQAAIGRTIRAALRARSSPESDLWQRLESQVARWGVFKPTVNDVANDVQIGAVDAGIVWDTTVSSPAYQRTLNVIELPDISEQSEQVTMAILASSRQTAAAWEFAHYLTDPERGQQFFRLHGFRSVPPAAGRSALDEVGAE